jgi:hypothetical protein
VCDYLLAHAAEDVQAGPVAVHDSTPLRGVEATCPVD